MMKRFSLLACTVSTLLLPLTSFAATLTPQQALDRSLVTAVQEHRSERSSFDLDVRYDTRVLKKDEFTTGDEHTRLHVVLGSETFMRSDTNADGIFTLRVPQFEMTSGSQDPIRVQNPFTLEARLVNHVLYVRLSDVAPMLLAQIPTPSTSTEPDFRALIGTWIKIDPAELGADTQDLSLLSGGTTDLAKESNLKDLRALIAPGSVFQVTGVETRSKNAAGDQILRLRVRINPKFVDRLLNYQDAQMVKMGGMKMTAKARATAKKEMQTALAPLKLVAVVNATKLSLDRVEGSYVKATSLYRYDWINNKEKKYYNGKATTDVRFGISIQGIADRQVPIPEPTLSMKTLLDQWKQAMTPPADPTPAPELLPTPSPEPPIYTSPTAVAPVNGSDHIRGNGQAPVTVIVYSDYECPFCQRHEPSIQSLLREFPQDVRVIYRNYPLTTIHPNAQVAAEAAECAGRVGGSTAFWSMHDQLFAQGTSLGTVPYTTLASQLGLNPQTFEACMNNHEGANKINQDVMTGNDAGVNGTPATFVNGVLISGAVPYDTLRQEVMRAINGR